MTSEVSAGEGDDESSVFSSYPLSEEDRKRLPIAFEVIKDALANFALGSNYPPFNVRERAQSLAGVGTASDWNRIFNAIENPIQDRLANLAPEAWAVNAYASWYGTSISTIERTLLYYNLKEDFTTHRHSLTLGSGLRILSQMFREKRNHTNQDLIDYFHKNIPQMDISKMASDIKLFFPEIRTEADVYRTVESLELSYVLIWQQNLTSAQIDYIRNQAFSVLNVTLSATNGSFLSIANSLVALTKDRETVINNAREVIGCDPDALRNILHFTRSYLKTLMSDVQVSLITEMRRREKPATISEIALVIQETEGAVRSRIAKQISGGILVKLTDPESNLKANLSIVDAQSPKRFDDTRFSRLRENGEWNQEKLYDYLLVFGDQTLDWQAAQLECSRSTIKAWRLRFGIFDPGAKSRTVNDPAENLKVAVAATDEKYEDARARLAAEFKAFGNNKPARQKIILDMYWRLFQRDVKLNEETTNLNNIPSLKTLSVQLQVNHNQIAGIIQGAFKNTIETHLSIYDFLKKNFSVNEHEKKSLPAGIDQVLFDDFDLKVMSKEGIAVLDNERKELQNRTLRSVVAIIRNNNDISLSAEGIANAIGISRVKLVGLQHYSELPTSSRRIFDSISHLVSEVAQLLNSEIKQIKENFMSGNLTENQLVYVSQLLKASPFLNKGKAGENANIALEKKSGRELILVFAQFQNPVVFQYAKNTAKFFKLNDEKFFSRGSMYGVNGNLEKWGVFDSFQEFRQLLAENAQTLKSVLRAKINTGIQLSEFQQTMLKNAEDILAMPQAKSRSSNTPPQKELAEELPNDPKSSGPCEDLSKKL